MKKVLSIIAMATLAVLFCGCNKENAPATGSKSVTISASMPDDEITTKTDLNGTSLTWKEGDKIYLSAPTNANTWSLAQGDISPRSISPDGKMASFILNLSQATDFSSNDVYVGYYGMRADSANDYANGGWYAFNDGREAYLMYINPCVQEYYRPIAPPIAPNGDYLAMAGPTAYPSLQEENTVHFQNLMSIIKIDVQSSKERTLSSIKVETKEGDPLSGGFWAWRHNFKERTLTARTPHNFSAVPNNNNSNTPIKKDFSAGTYGNWVMLDNINVTFKDIAEYFYLVVFPGEHETLEFTLTDRDGNQKVVAWNDKVRLGAAKIVKFPTITWD